MNTIVPHLWLPDLAFALALGLLVAELFALGFAAERAAFSLPWWRDFVGFGLIVFLSTAAGRIWLGLAGSSMRFFLPYAASALIMGIFVMAPYLRSRSEPEEQRRARPDPSGTEATLFIVLLIALSTMIVFGTAVS